MIVLILILSLAVLLPLLWLVSEFQDRKWLRITLGCSAIALSFAIAWLVGTLELFNYNSWFGAATSDLIQCTVHELEAGNTDRVIEELKRLESKYQPSYENRANYDELAAEYVHRVSSSPARHDSIAPTPTAP